MSSLRTVSNAGRLTLARPSSLAILMAVLRAGLSTKLESVHNRNEPHSGAGLLGAHLQLGQNMLWSGAGFKLPESWLMRG